MRSATAIPRSQDFQGVQRPPARGSIRLRCNGESTITPCAGHTCDPLCVKAGWGSIGVLEDFFVGVVGQDISAETLRGLGDRHYMSLRNRLADAVAEYDPGLAGAQEWRSKLDLSPLATLLVAPSALNKEVAASAIYLRQILLEDPVWHLPEDARQLSYSMGELAAIRPLVASGSLVLYPTAIGQSVWGHDFHGFNAEQSLWGTEVYEWAEELHASLPQGQVGEVAAAVTSALTAAAAFDVDTAAVGRYAPRIPPVSFPQDCEYRHSAISRYQPSRPCLLQTLSPCDSTRRSPCKCSRHSIASSTPFQLTLSARGAWGRRSPVKY